MKKSFLLIYSTMCILNSVYSQNPLVKKWDYRYGGTNYDTLTCIQQTADGGYIAGGYSISGISGDKTQASRGLSDYWVVKTDANGILQWEKRYGGTQLDELYALHQTNDGGYILGGASASGIGGDRSEASRGGYDYWIVKIDSVGTVKWDHRFGGTADDILHAIRQTKDGGYILGGQTISPISGDVSQASRGFYDYWIVKTDSLGVKQWDKRYGGDGYDWLFSIEQTTDKGFILGGYSYSNANGEKTKNNWDATVFTVDYWIVKTDSLGAKQWDASFGGTDRDELYSVIQASDKGYLLGGISYSGLNGNKSQGNFGGGSNADYWVVKTDSGGAKQWDKIYGGTNNEDEFGNVQQTQDGGFLLAGTSYSQIDGNKQDNNFGFEQEWVMKIDALGNRQWDKSLRTNGHEETGYAYQTKDGCYVMATYSKGGIAGEKTQEDWDVTHVTHDYWIIKFCDSTLTIHPVSHFNSSDTIFCDEAGKCINFTDLSTGSPTTWKWSFPGATPDTSTKQNPANICYYTPGTYPVTLIVSNSGGTDTLTVSSLITFVNGATTPVISFSNDTLFSSHAASYQWFYNGTPILNATDSFYVALQDGGYNVYITDSLGCSKLGNGIVFTATREMKNASAVEIYPNPAKDQFVIQTSNSAYDGTSIEMFNVWGEKVYSDILKSKKKTIDCKLPSGIYLIKIKDKSNSFMNRIIISQ